jgi:hypothetical protein
METLKTDSRQSTMPKVLLFSYPGRNSEKHLKNEHSRGYSNSAATSRTRRTNDSSCQRRQVLGFGDGGLATPRIHQQPLRGIWQCDGDVQHPESLWTLRWNQCDLQSLQSTHIDATEFGSQPTTNTGADRESNAVPNIKDGIEFLAGVGAGCDVRTAASFALCSNGVKPSATATQFTNAGTTRLCKGTCGCSQVDELDNTFLGQSANLKSKIYCDRISSYMECDRFLLPNTQCPIPKWKKLAKNT